MSDSSPCVCTALRKASRAVTRLYDDRLAATGLTTTQFAVLRNLDRHGSLELSRLADILVMDRTTLYRTLAPIERHGWITIEDGIKGRAKLAALTDAGRAIKHSATAAWATTQAEIIDTIGATQWQTLEEQLRRLAETPLERTA